MLLNSRFDVVARVLIGFVCFLKAARFTKGLEGNMVDPVDNNAVPQLRLFDGKNLKYTSKGGPGHRRRGTASMCLLLQRGQLPDQPRDPLGHPTGAGQGRGRPQVDRERQRRRGCGHRGLWLARLPRGAAAGSHRHRPRGRHLDVPGGGCVIRRHLGKPYSDGRPGLSFGAGLREPHSAV